MQLGTFSVSLAVADLAASRAFYEALGFEAIAGEPTQNWLILRNGEAKIGLFQGMFDANILTFNPEDARAVERVALERGLIAERKTKGEEGPTHFVMVDPDGNTILIDQH